VVQIQEEGESLKREPLTSTRTVRGRVWLALLRLQPPVASEYVSLLESGKSVLYDKIKEDTLRTLRTEASFQARVSEPALVRILNAFVHSVGACLIQLLEFWCRFHTFFQVQTRLWDTFRE
jgi:cell cycle arrest protein BUB2